jgi:hypothetical protein
MPVPEKPMNYCEHCGSPLVQGAQFCTRCGSPVSPAPASVGRLATPRVGAADAAPVSTDSAERSGGSKRRRTIALASVGAVVVAATAVAGFYALRPSDESPAALEPSLSRTTDVTTSGANPSPGIGPASSAELVAFIEEGDTVDATEYKFVYSGGSSSQPYFTTPSGNIGCWMGGFSQESGVTCMISEYSFPDPPAQPCGDDEFVPNYFLLETDEITHGDCLHEGFLESEMKVLPYGSTLSDGTHACRSDSTFLACAALETGTGFILSRETYREYGTAGSS